MDPLSNLPSPILLEIVKLIPNFPSLQNLLRASPSIASLFDEYAVEIVEAIASSSLSKQSQRLLAIISIIRSPSFSCQSFEDFMHSYTKATASSNHLDRAIPPFVFRTLVSSASYIQHLAHCCLKELLDRSHSIRPSHLRDPGFRFSHNAINEWPEGSEYLPEDTGCPSWVEEQRILRALWRLETFFNFRRAAMILQWENGDQRMLQGLGPHEFWRDLARWEVDEIECVYEYLQGLSRGNQNGENVRISHLPPAPSTKQISNWPEQAPQEDELGITWLQTQNDIEHSSPGLKFFNAAAARRVTSPLRGTDFREFRRLGFGIWDLKRMCALEMMNVPQKIQPPVNGMAFQIGVDKYMSTDNLFFTWRSIKTK